MAPALSYWITYAAQEPDAYIVMLTGSKIEADVMTSQQKRRTRLYHKPFTRSKIAKHIAEYMEFREKQIKSLLRETEKHRHETLSAVA